MGGFWSFAAKRLARREVRDMTPSSRSGAYSFFQPNSSYLLMQEDIVVMTVDGMELGGRILGREFYCSLR